MLMPKSKSLQKEGDGTCRNLCVPCISRHHCKKTKDLTRIIITKDLIISRPEAVASV